jgi:hypothetical protein
MKTSMQQRLEDTRAGYAEEGLWLRFLVDSYTGAGGFQGRVRQAPAGFWGAITDAYRNYATLSGTGYAELGESYLDQYNREDQEKYRRRVNVAHYLNYVKPTTNLKISYLVRKPHKRNNVPDKLAEWIGRTGYDRGFRRRALCAAVLGWFPMLVDMPRRAEGVRTAFGAGDMDPYAVLSLPCHLRHYELDEQGQFVWAKMATRFSRKATWDADAVEITRYTIWTRTDFTVYETEGSGGVASEPVTGTHLFKQVPIVSWRTDTSVEDHIKADSINADIALEGRRLFNLLSELDEHLRSQVFALLIYPMASPNPTDTVEVGVENGLQVSAEQKNVPFYLAPPGSVAATLEARIVATIIEIYRVARVEYDRASGTESSAQSKQQNFEQTNLAIVDFATSLAAADRETLILVGRALGIAEEKLQEIECVAHESYASEDLSLELEQAIMALTIRELGQQARVELLLRLAQQLLPHLAPDTRKVIEQEIIEAVAQAEQDAQALKAEHDEGGDDPDGGDEPDDDGDDARDDSEDDVPKAAE